MKIHVEGEGMLRELNAYVTEPGFWSPDFDDLPVEVTETFAFYRMSFTEFHRLGFECREFLYERLGNIVRRLAWCAFVRGREVALVTVRDDYFYDPKRPCLSVVLLFGDRRTDVVGFDDLGNPCEDWPS